jgi:Ca2+-binding RTX toxin-like protein
LSISIAGTNDAPVLTGAIAAQAAREKRAFAFTIPAGSFTDVDNADTLSYRAQAVDAAGNLAALPGWLTFNAATRTFSGTPGSTAGGSFDFVVTATDLAGASATSRFTLNISDEFAGTGATANVITSGAADAVLNGTSLSEIVIGKAGADTLYGGAGNDVLDGGAGADLLFGDAGNDTLKFSVDTTWALGSLVTNVGSPGNAGSNLGLSIYGKNRSLDNFDGGAGTDTLVGTSGADAIVLDKGGALTALIKNIEIIDAGAGDDVVDLTSTRFALGDITVLAGDGNDVVWASSGNDILYGGAGNDTLVGGVGNDLLDGGTGADILQGGDGNDIYIVDSSLDLVTETVTGGTDLIKSSITYMLPAYVENLLLTGTAAATGTGSTGVNVLAGNDGANSLLGLAGNDALFGGAGADTLDGGADNNLLAGGWGADTIKTGAGKNIIAFNRGDGADTIITSSGAVNTLSLGKGITYASLALRKTGNDLILDAGSGDTLTFKDWYISSANRTTTTVQFFKEGTADYNAASADKTLNKKVETFNFVSLVNAADTTRNALPVAQQPLSTWGLSNGLLSAYLSSSDSLAMGGDLAYGYSQTSAFAGFGLAAAQVTLGSSFATSAQSLQKPVISAPTLDLTLGT